MRAWEFGLARRVQPSRPASACSSPYSRLNLILTGFLPSSAAASNYETAIRHRVSPEFIGSRKCVPMAFTAESPPGQGQLNNPMNLFLFVPYFLTPTGPTVLFSLLIIDMYNTVHIFLHYYNKSPNTTHSACAASLCRPPPPPRGVPINLMPAFHQGHAGESGPTGGVSDNSSYSACWLQSSRMNRLY